VPIGVEGPDVNSKTGEPTMNELISTGGINRVIAGVSPTRDQGKASDLARRAAKAAHASGRRRFVDPATCDREYSGAEMEFLGAIQEYKRSSGRLFPTWSEVLEVVRGLGYEKASN
jgi:hypothetical protein